jgi:hypothetical protein
MLWDGMEMVPRIPVCPWQSIPIASFEYQSLSTQTQSWSCDVLACMRPSASLDNKDTKQFIDYVHRILITGLRLDLEVKEICTN